MFFFRALQWIAGRAPPYPDPNTARKCFKCGPKQNKGQNGNDLWNPKSTLQMPAWPPSGPRPGWSDCDSK